MFENRRRPDNLFSCQGEIRSTSLLNRQPNWARITIYEMTDNKA